MQYIASTVTDEQKEILTDRDALIALLRRYSSQNDAAAAIGVTSAVMSVARNYHNIPPRPPGTRPYTDLSQMSPRDVLSDPDLTESLMNRAHGRAGICPPYCPCMDRPSCPKIGERESEEWDDIDDDEWDGDMHADCPIRHYDGSSRNGDTPIQRMFDRARPSVVKRLAAEFKAAKTQCKEPEPRPDPGVRDAETPESFRLFLKSVQEG